MRKALKPSNNVIYSNEAPATVLGVKGRFNNRVFDKANNLFTSQTFVATRPYNEKGFKKGSQITVEIRFDDNCKNGHQSFAITGDVKEPGTRDSSMCGCIHEDIAKYFPELSHLIKWHLMDTDEPMHYVANTVYHASNRDHWGLLKGEASKSPKHQDTHVLFGDSPISHKISARFHTFIVEKMKGDNIFYIVPVEHEKKPGDTYNFAAKYTFDGYACKWHECPFDKLKDAQEWQQALTACKVEFVTVPTLFGEGKERDFEAARRSAVWPEATDEQLSLPREELEKLLKDRLSGMVAEFKAAMLSIGMEWREMPEGEE